MVDRFIGRSRELSVLEREYCKPGFGMFVLYGRRRVGKSTLIREFVKGKRSISITGVKGDPGRNISALVSTIPSGHGPVSGLGLEDALSSWAEMSREGRLIVVIDEYPYMANSLPSISSVLQLYIDEVFSGCDMFLILCGSSIGAMEEGVLGYSSPLYGRRTGQMKMAPLTYLESVPYLEGFSNEERLRIYAMVGGIPPYLLKFDSSRGIDSYIVENFLEDTAFFRMEPDYIMREELRDPAAYGSVIAALASGRFRLGEIADVASMDTSTASHKLDELIRLDIVRKVSPYGGSKKKTGYRLVDNMFRFYYRFIYGSYVPFDEGEVASSLRRISDGMPSYLGYVFEDVCRTYVRRNMGYNTVGTWWGENPGTRASAEIDVVAYDADDPEREVLFGECKCRSSPVTIDVLDGLISSSKLVDCSGRRYALFSTGGFSDNVVEVAERDGIALLTLDDLYSTDAR